MISGEVNNIHLKHPKMSSPAIGEFGRNELAITGSSCDNIRQLAGPVKSLLPALKVSYAD